MYSYPPSSSLSKPREPVLSVHNWSRPKASRELDLTLIKTVYWYGKQPPRARFRISYPQRCAEQFFITPIIWCRPSTLARDGCTIRCGDHITGRMWSKTFNDEWRHGWADDGAFEPINTSANSDYSPPVSPRYFFALDILGPLTKMSTGNRFDVLIADHYSKLTRVIPTKPTTAPQISLSSWISGQCTSGSQNSYERIMVHN